jgi:ribokinase
MSSMVIVVGSVNVDLFTYVARLPHPGETVVGGRFARAHGGKGANQAVAAARLGARTLFVGAVGNDDLGRAATDALGQEGVDVSQVRTVDGHTGVAQIIVDAKGENLIAVASGANDGVTGDMVGESLDRVAMDNAVVCSVLEIPDEAVFAAARIASARGWRFVLNPAPARPVTAELVALCSVLTPNQHEVAQLGLSTSDMLEAGARSVVVTRGADGADLIRAEREVHHQPSHQIKAVDTTGAGDAFSGALAWALAEGADLERAVEIATIAGARSTVRPGARSGMPTRAELEAALGAHG